MTQYAVVKRYDVELTEQQSEGVRLFLFGAIGGLSDDDESAWRKLWRNIKKLEVGEMFNFEVKFPRNWKFHKKFMQLLHYAFDMWEPQRNHKSYRGQPVTKNFESFRADITILAGYYEQTFDVANNKFKLLPMSISFAKMDDAEFERLYNAVVDVILQHVLNNYKDRDELDAIVDKLSGFF